VTRADIAPKVRAEGKRFTTFLVTGGIAALVNILSRIAFSLVMVYEVAVVLAYLAGMATAYILTRLFVFEPSGRSAQGEFFRFAVVNIVALAQVWLVSMLLARAIFPWLGFTWHTETVAHVIGVLSPVLTSYVGHQRFTFAQKSRQGRPSGPSSPAAG
jgi:putative flippase GtrA